MKLVINFISKLGVDSVSKLIGFLTLPLITRALGPEGYGQFAYLFVILSYFGFFIDFGYLSYGTNKLCEKTDSKIVIGKIISLQLLTAIFSYIILIIVAYFFLETGKYILLLFFSSIFISQIFSIRYYYLAGNKLYYNSISELAGQLIYAALIFTVFINHQSVFTLIIVSLVQAYVTAIFLFLPYIRKNKIELNLSPRKNLKTLKDAYKLGIASKAEAITASFIILCAGFFLNEESVGLYNASFKIYLILLTVVQGVSYSLMPLLLRNVKKSEGNNFNKISIIFYIYIFIGIVLSLITFFFSEQIISVMFGEKFSGSVGILRNFSFTILLWPLVMFMSLVTLAFNKYNYILFTSVSSSLISIILSLLLIRNYGISGAGFVLPFVAGGTILINLFFLKKIAAEENFRLYSLFSIVTALNELKILFKK
ncbi:MAG: oligosaccharide flippase family protein [Ignavibacteria bacterium]|nr:oligosaccharide flippase family protein [Ignavibacteria bacterium]